jgi:hypothetical protein
VLINCDALLVGGGGLEMFPVYQCMGTISVCRKSDVLPLLGACSN